MSHLHRYYARNAGAVWELEGRWMRAAGSFRPPAAAQWIATQACDLTCQHCYSHAGPRGRDELTTDEALAMVDALADLGCDQLVIAGGEPLLRKDLDVVVEHAVGRGVRWAIHTHGGLVRARQELFERFPPSLAAISLDGPEAVHDRLRGRPGSFRDALAAISWLRTTACPMVVAGTTVNRQNADTLADLLPVVRASGAHSWGLHLFAPEGRGAEHTGLLPTPGQLRRVAGFARRARAITSVDLDNEWGSAGELDPFYRDDPYLCGAGRFTFVIAANGDVMPCTTTDPAEAEGNVRTHDLRDLWRTGFARFRGGADEAARPGRSAASTCADGSDCWLQTRNGNSCREHAFDVRPAPVASLPDVLPPPPGPPRAHGALRWAAAFALASIQPAVAGPEPAPTETTADQALPPEFDEEAWAGHVAAPDLGVHASPWSALKERLVTGAGREIDAYPRVRKALAGPAPVPVPVADLLAALDEAEASSVWDPWLVGELFMRAPPAPSSELVPLFTRLERHARLADALVLAKAETGAITYLPWRKKSAPPANYRAVQAPVGLGSAAVRHLNRVTTWQTEATVDLTLTVGTARLHRAGRISELAVGERVRLARFDVIELSGTLMHADLGPAARGSSVTVSGRHADSTLATESLQGLALIVQGALGGDQTATDRLATMLPLAHGAIRTAVAEQPHAAGAPALRQLLALFDH